MEDANPSCDTLLFVATDDEEAELRTAATAMGLTSNVIQSRSGTEYIDLGTPGISRVYCVRTAVGPLAFGGSASRAIHSRSETGATSVISVGMAFGVDRKSQRHGDVLVSRSVLPYDNRDGCGSFAAENSFANSIT